MNIFNSKLNVGKICVAKALCPSMLYLRLKSLHAYRIFYGSIETQSTNKYVSCWNAYKI